MNFDEFMTSKFFRIMIKIKFIVMPFVLLMIIGQWGIDVYLGRYDKSSALITLFLFWLVLYVMLQPGELLTNKVLLNIKEENEQVLRTKKKKGMKAQK